MRIKLFLSFFLLLTIAINSATNPVEPIAKSKNLKIGVNDISAIEKSSSTDSSDIVSSITVGLVPKGESLENVLEAAKSKVETDYTIPSWTLFLIAKNKAIAENHSSNLANLRLAMNNLQTNTTPYNVNMTINGDPTTQLGFAWFANASVSTGYVQIVEKNDALEIDFTMPSYQFAASATPFRNINYVVFENEIPAIAEIPADTKRSYTSFKALTTGLKPNTYYSFRVGNQNAWSKVGTFKTAASKPDSFKFIYLTDTQARTNDAFDVSQRTITAAVTKTPDAKFVLITGDFIDTNYNGKSAEWEWEQWFEKAYRDAAYKIPLVPTAGNHDTDAAKNYQYHFNTDNSFNRDAIVPSFLNGINYSFVYGDALFIVFSLEDTWRTGYSALLETWIRAQVVKFPNTKWRIAAYHKDVFSGGGHSLDAECVGFRTQFLPVFADLNIDFALQGHDHVYNVIGPVNNATVKVNAGSVTELQSVPVVFPENLTGKQGGTFNIQDGSTLYFLNGAASNKVYNPLAKTTIDENLANHQVAGYWNLFKGKFGQGGLPTFSEITVSSNDIIVTTFTINSDGQLTMYDSFKIIKQKLTSIH